MAATFLSDNPDLQSAWHDGQVVVQSLATIRGQVQIAHNDSGVAPWFLLNAYALLCGAIGLADFPRSVLQEPEARTFRHLRGLVDELRVRFRAGGFEPVAQSAYCCLSESGLILSQSGVFLTDLGKTPATVIFGLRSAAIRLRWPENEDSAAICSWANTIHARMLELAHKLPEAMVALQHLADRLGRPPTKEDFETITASLPEAEAQTAEIQQRFKPEHLSEFNRAVDIFHAHPLGQALPGRLLELLPPFDARQTVAELERELLLVGKGLGPDTRKDKQRKKSEQHSRPRNLQELESVRRKADRDEKKGIRLGESIREYVEETYPQLRTERQIKAKVTNLSRYLNRYKHLLE